MSGAILPDHFSGYKIVLYDSEYLYYGLFLHSKIFLKCYFFKNKKKNGGFPGGTVVENLPANAGDTGSSPGLGRSHMPWSN